MLVGDDGPSANYVAMKHRDCAELGIASFDEHLPADATRPTIDAVVDRFNADPAVDAYLCSTRSRRASTTRPPCCASIRPRTSTACTR